MFLFSWFCSLLSLLLSPFTMSFFCGDFLAFITGFPPAAADEAVVVVVEEFELAAVVETEVGASFNDGQSVVGTTWKEQ